MSAEPAAGQIRHLDLRVTNPGVGHDDYVYPVLTILVDGEDLFTTAGRWGHTGRPAAEILTEGDPLLPAQLPRRVAVCAHSVEPIMLAPVIRGDGGLVMWSDFRDFWQSEGSQDFPVIEAGSINSDPVGIPDLIFDASQYAAVIRQVSAAREWESGPWRTAVLFHEYLRPRWWARPGPTKWILGYVEPVAAATGRFLVTCWDDHQRHIIVVALAAAPGTPAQQARQMADFLLATPEHRWPISRRIDREHLQ